MENKKRRIPSSRNKKWIKKKFPLQSKERTEWYDDETGQKARSKKKIELELNQVYV